MASSSTTAARASTSETSPLLPIAENASSSRPIAPPKPARSVTFNPQISTASPPRRRPAFPQQQQPQQTSSPIATSSGLPNPHPTTGSLATGSSSSVSRDIAPAPSALAAPLSALNNKLRRRNSSGATLAALPPLSSFSKIGPQRTTRTAQKLKLLPNPEHGEDGPDEESGRDVYSQFTRIKDPTARRDAARLGKEDRARIPRVTAYCTAGSYRIDDLMRFLKGRSKTKSTNAKLFDECIYSPYSYRTKDNLSTSPGGRRRRDSRAEREQRQEEEREAFAARAEVQSRRQRRFSDSAIEVDETTERRREDLIDLSTDAGDTTLDTGEPSQPTNTLAEDGSSLVHRRAEEENSPDLDTTVHIPEVFLFEYGVVVIWGMTLKEEQRFLKEIAKFEQEKLGKDDIQTEEFNFYYTREYQARIYNDFISLRDKRNYMTKLAISHALAQSTKTSLYEDLVDATITTTQGIPATIARTGRINLTRREINMQIGELFILRINIHLQGSVLDAPELMWAEPQLEPVYQAVRSYLEMDQRVALLQERVSVIADLLAVLKDQLSHTHGEYLEWIVIILIAAEILVAAINIVVDLYAGE